MRTRDACSCEVGFGMFGGSLLLLQLSCLVEDNDIPSSKQFRVSQLRVCINCMIRSLYGLGRDHTIRQNNFECTLTREKDESIGVHTMHTCHVQYAAGVKVVGTTIVCIQCSSPRQHLTKCRRYGGQIITVIEQMSFYGACHYKNQHFYGTDGTNTAKCLRIQDKSQQT